jgi:protein TonB
MPQILKQSTPDYTDEAIKNKVEGIVILEAVIRKNGRVDSFKVLRGLGYGLEEKAMQEISKNWRFRPGTLEGEPVDVFATIEVQFNLK